MFFDLIWAIADGVIVWRIFSWQTLSYLVPIKYHLNADNIHPFMTTLYFLISVSNRIHHVTKLKSKCFLEHGNEFAHIHSSQSNQVWYVV